MERFEKKFQPKGPERYETFKGLVTEYQLSPQLGEFLETILKEKLNCFEFNVIKEKLKIPKEDLLDLLSILIKREVLTKIEVVRPFGGYYLFTEKFADDLVQFNLVTKEEAERYKRDYRREEIVYGGWEKKVNKKLKFAERKLLNIYLEKNLNLATIKEISKETKISHDSLRALLSDLRKMKILKQAVPKRSYLNPEFVEDLFKNGVIDESRRNKWFQDAKKEEAYNSFKKKDGKKLGAKEREILDLILKENLIHFDRQQLVKLGVSRWCSGKALRSYIESGIIKRSIERRYLLTKEAAKKLFEAGVIGEEKRNEIILSSMREDCYDLFLGKKKKLPPYLRRLLDLVFEKKLESFGSKSLSSLIGIQRQRLMERLSRLKKFGILEITKKGTYSLNKNFKELLEKREIEELSEFYPPEILKEIRKTGKEITPKRIFTSLLLEKYGLPIDKESIEWSVEEIDNKLKEILTPEKIRTYLIAILYKGKLIPKKFEEQYGTIPSYETSLNVLRRLYQLNPSRVNYLVSGSGLFTRFPLEIAFEE